MNIEDESRKLYLLAQNTWWGEHSEEFMKEVERIIREARKEFAIELSRTM